MKSSVHSASAAAIGWESASAGAPLYVITLASSAAPLEMSAPKAPELAGLAIFRSRQLEDGRERFRLHIGYFPSAAAAETALPAVRAQYPAAIVAVAPQSSLGSLDDTGQARFSILHPAASAVAATRAKPAVPAEAAATPVLAPRAAPTPRLVAVAVPAAVAAPAVIAAPVAAPAAAPPVLSAADAVNIPAVEHLPAVQHYAVQLIWGRAPIDLARVPVLAIYSGYLMYAVETEPGPRRFFGVRLGFYADVLSARLVAQYVRSEFKGVAVVPVSAREMTRASTAAIKLGPSRSRNAAATRWPRSALAVDMGNLSRAVTPAMM